MISNPIGAMRNVIIDPVRYVLDLALNKSIPSNNQKPHFFHFHKANAATEIRRFTIPKSGRRW